MLGDISRLDEDIRSRIQELTEATKDNGGLNFQIAINYGSRDEILRAVRRLAEDCVEEGLLRHRLMRRFSKVIWIPMIYPTRIC